ncbi:MAG: 30S ribosomal protein S20 [Candidatus Pacebacteria bacterium]|nr:30S ribosomal protein S20 [Candidatus Paceibacterota bacterium]
MPIIKAQKKSVRQSAKRRVFNDRRRRAMREAVKQIKELVAGKNYKEANELLPTAQKAIDKAVKRGVIKPNTASRKKSQVAKMVKEIA